MRVRFPPPAFGDIHMDRREQRIQRRNAELTARMDETIKNLEAVIEQKERLARAEKILKKSVKKSGQ